MDYNNIVTLFSFIISCTETDKPQFAIKQLVTGSSSLAVGKILVFSPILLSMSNRKTTAESGIYIYITYVIAQYDIVATKISYTREVVCCVAVLDTSIIRKYADKGKTVPEAYKS